MNFLIPPNTRQMLAENRVIKKFAVASNFMPLLQLLTSTHLTSNSDANLKSSLYWGGRCCITSKNKAEYINYLNSIEGISQDTKYRKAKRSCFNLASSINNVKKAFSQHLIMCDYNSSTTLYKNSPWIKL